MNRRRVHFAAFTLIELIMVMGILVLIAAVVAPSLRGFTVGREGVNTATQIVALGQYARTQAISQGRPYRLNFDEASRQYWLTAQDGGQFTAPANDMGQRFTAPAGVRLSVTVTPEAAVQPQVMPNVQQAQINGPPLIEQPSAQPNQLMQNPRDPGSTYMEFEPDGRTDQARIDVTDALGRTTQVVCESETETLHVAGSGAKP